MNFDRFIDIWYVLMVQAWIWQRKHCHCQTVWSGSKILSDHDFHNITLASPTTDYKRWKNEWIDEWMSMKEMEMWVNEGTNEWTSNEQNIYIFRVNIEWMSWWMPHNSRWCEWTSKYNTVYSSYNAHDNTVHVYLCLFTSDRLRGIHNANNPLFTKLSLAIYHQ